MDAAVIKFNALTDSVGAATQDHDLFVLGRFCFALIFIGGIHVGRIGRKLCSASVHAFVNGTNIHGVSLCANFVFSGFEQFGQATV